MSVESFHWIEMGTQPEQKIHPKYIQLDTQNTKSCNDLVVFHSNPILNFRHEILLLTWLFQVRRAKLVDFISSPLFWLLFGFVFQTLNHEVLQLNNAEKHTYSNPRYKNKLLHHLFFA